MSHASPDVHAGSSAMRLSLDDPDHSWTRKGNEFIRLIKIHKEHERNIYDAKKVLDIVVKIYVECHLR
jgi:hypothetical protein